MASSVSLTRSNGSQPSCWAAVDASMQSCQPYVRTDSSIWHCGVQQAPTECLLGDHVLAILAHAQRQAAVIGRIICGGFNDCSTLFNMAELALVLVRDLHKFCSTGISGMIRNEYGGLQVLASMPLAIIERQPGITRRHSWQRLLRRQARRPARSSSCHSTRRSLRYMLTPTWTFPCMDTRWTRRSAPCSR